MRSSRYACCLWLAVVGAYAPEPASGQLRDPGLVAAVHDALGRPGWTLAEEDLAAQTQLAAGGRSITTLEGIELLANLQILDLAQNNIEDLSPLAALTHLQFLNLESNSVRELQPLASLAELQFLVLNHNRIEDIRPLVQLPALVAVELLGNPLGEASLTVHIPALETRGVEVVYEMPGEGEGEPASEKGEWDYLGPLGLQRVLLAYDIAVSPADPQVVYALMADGLWRSADGGRQWQRTGFMLRGRHWGRMLAVDAEDPGTVYLRADVTLRSRDGGASWEAIEAPGFGLMASPGRGGRLFSVDVERGVHSSGYGLDLVGVLTISDDGGDSWRATEVGFVAAVPTTGFIHEHPADSRRLYALELESSGSKAARRLSQVLHSTDGGETWSRIETATDFMSLAPDPAAPGHLYALSDAAAWHSEDEGQSWERRGSLPTSWPTSTLQVHPANGDWLFAEALRKAWHSTDGGHSWQQLPFARPVLFSHPRDPGRAFLREATGFLDLGMLHATRDRGTTWEPVEMATRQVAVTSLAFGPDGRPYAGVAGGDGAPRSVHLFVTADSGAGWEPRVGRLPEEPTLYGGGAKALHINPRRPEIMVCWMGSGFARSGDGGASWEVLRLSDSRGVVEGQAPIVSDPDDGAKYYAVDLLDHALYRSDDYGSTWERRRRDVHALAVDPSDFETVYIAYTEYGATGKVWRSADGGVSWEYLGEVAGGESIHDLAAHPGMEGRLYGVTGKGIYVSDSGGREWQRLVEMASDFPGQLRFSPHDPLVMYLFNQRRLWESLDAGTSWTSIGEDLAGAPWFSDVRVDPVVPGRVYAATPWGVYRSQRLRGITAVVEERGARPLSCALQRNYPNPFNGETVIGYEVAAAGPVELAVYDVLGRRVAHLVGEEQGAGAHQVMWDGLDGRGRPAATGVYLCRLRFGGQVAVRRMLLLR